MTNTIDSSRAEMLAEVRAKRESALRFARTGNSREEEYWLGVAGRMTAWLEHLEERDRARGTPAWPDRGDGRSRGGIDLPPSARRSRAPLQAEAAE